MLCVGSADDACGGWTSTSPLLRPLSFLVSLSPSSPSAFELSFPGRNFTLNE